MTQFPPFALVIVNCWVLVSPLPVNTTILCQRGGGSQAGHRSFSASCTTWVR